MTPRCAHCKHSEGRASMLAGSFVIWCSLWKTIPTKVCDEWQRAPGADDA